MRRATFLLTGAVLGHCSFLSAAAVSYNADFAVLDAAQTEFLQYTQVVTEGATQPGIHSSYIWNTGTGGNVTLASRWGNYAPLVLATAGNNADGVFEDATASLVFTPYLDGAAIGDVRFGMSARQLVKPIDERSNRYPAYRVDYNGTNLVLSEHAGYARQRTLDSVGLSIAAATQYRLELAAAGTSADADVTITAKLFEVGNPTAVAILSGVDHAKTTVQEGGADWADNGQDVVLSGQFGFYGGATSGSFGGIEVSAFSVAVPEPMSASLVLLPAVGTLLARRRVK